MVCEKSVKIVNSTITFNGDNAVVYLCENRHNYHLFASLNNNTVLYIGKNNYINNTLNIVLSEQKHCFIGNDGLISFGIWIRNADPHLVYNCETNKRVNPSKSIFIGDHVWIGQSAMILKGTQIDSGSIIGAMSLVAGKKVPHNESWGGNPCKKISDSIFWEGSCVHKWMERDTECSLDFEEFAKNRKLENDSYKYSYDADSCITFEEIDKELSSKNPEGILKYLGTISAKYSKNRFVHRIETSKKRFLFRENR